MPTVRIDTSVATSPPSQASEGEGGGGGGGDEERHPPQHSQQQQQPSIGRGSAAADHTNPSPYVSVLLCDGCHQPLATLDEILDEHDGGGVKGASNTFTYRVEGLFRGPSSHHPSRMGMDPASTPPTTSAAANEEEDDEEEPFTVCAYSSLNPCDHRFDLVRVKPFFSTIQMASRSSLSSSSTLSAAKDRRQQQQQRRQQQQQRRDAKVKRNPTLGEDEATTAVAAKSTSKSTTTTTSSTATATANTASAPLSAFCFDGPYSPENTFFVSHQWQVCHCCACGKFLGWGFTKEHPSVLTPSTSRFNEGTMIVREDTPPDFVGLVLRMCTGSDYYPLERLRRLRSTHAIRLQTFQALKTYTRRWRRLLYLCRTDAIVFSLEDMFKSRRREFLKQLEEEDSESVCTGQWGESATAAGVSESTAADTLASRQALALLMQEGSWAERSWRDEDEARQQQQEDWDLILSLLPPCFTGLLLAALSMPLVQRPIISPGNGQRSQEWELLRAQEDAARERQQMMMVPEGEAAGDSLDTTSFFDSTASDWSDFTESAGMVTPPQLQS